MSAATDSFSRDAEKYAVTTENHAGDFSDRAPTAQSRTASFRYDKNNIYINENQQR